MCADFKKNFRIPAHIALAFQIHADLFARDRVVTSHPMDDGISRIAVVIAENESPHDVSVGDLIARIPMLQRMSSLFPNAMIQVILKPYHLRLNLLPATLNITYKACKGNAAFRGETFFRKDYRDMFSIDDFTGDWDLVVDSSSRDGWRIMRDILNSTGKQRIRKFVPCNMLTQVWLANIFAPTICPRSVVRLRAHELFVCRLLFHLTGQTSVSLDAIKAPRTAHAAMYVPGPCRKACLIVDKSPVLSKIWLVREENAFDIVASDFQHANWDVYVHRFMAPDEEKASVPQYRRSNPTFLMSGFDELLEFFNDSRPSLVLGIDTGVMHFVSASVPGQWIAEVFVNSTQNPVVWAVPDSDVFLGFDAPRWRDEFAFADPEILTSDLIRRSEYK
jgi:hypothetical protein